eukprot:CAMPEP_0170743764 /NCGR_PEP_ID=MMETSP0437-20130122/7434_1 /TAXON_ID=0 /ORGANISM="Sexangularia sp." /LENGTH=107 /DNA_ID=CAMNT_0011082439 /DNA_START=103 /DNA_END=422 /DNA_ORIENTATION=+
MCPTQRLILGGERGEDGRANILQLVQGTRCRADGREVARKAVGSCVASATVRYPATTATTSLSESSGLANRRTSASLALTLTHLVKRLFYLTPKGRLLVGQRAKLRP